MAKLSCSRNPISIMVSYDCPHTHTIFEGWTGSININFKAPFLWCQDKPYSRLAPTLSWDHNINLITRARVQLMGTWTRNKPLHSQQLHQNNGESHLTLQLTGAIGIELSTLILILPNWTTGNPKEEETHINKALLQQPQTSCQPNPSPPICNPLTLKYFSKSTENYNQRPNTSSKKIETKKIILSNLYFNNLQKFRWLNL